MHGRLSCTIGKLGSVLENAHGPCLEPKSCYTTILLDAMDRYVVDMEGLLYAQGSEIPSIRKPEVLLPSKPFERNGKATESLWIHINILGHMRRACINKIGFCSR